MGNLISEFGKLNNRERLKGLAIAIIAAILAIVLEAIYPILDNFVETKVLDFSTFGEAVNLATIFKAAFGAAAAYLGLTKYSGKKQ